MGTDIFLEDTDNDGLTDGEEVELGTDPTQNDSDGDKVPDGEEIARQSDPLDIKLVGESAAALLAKEKTSRRDSLYNDVNKDDVYYRPIQKLSDTGVFKGVGEGLFKPDQVVNRAVIVTVLHRIEGEPKIANNAFYDVLEGSWYYNSVSWAFENNIVNGMGNGLFSPEVELTKEQIIAIIYRYKGNNEKVKFNPNSFADTDQISDWAKDAVAWANSKGLRLANEDGMLMPKSSVTRKELAYIVEKIAY